VPGAVVEVKLTELHHVGCGEAESKGANRDALGVSSPTEPGYGEVRRFRVRKGLNERRIRVNAEGIEELLAGIVHH
jgi:hypothetical protein